MKYTRAKGDIPFFQRRDQAVPISGRRKPAFYPFETTLMNATVLSGENGRLWRYWWVLVVFTLILKTSFDSWFDPNWRHQLTNNLIFWIVLAIFTLIGGAIYSLMTRVTPAPLYLFVGGGAAIGALIGFALYLSVNRGVPTTEVPSASPSPSPATPSPTATPVSSQQFADFEKRFDKAIEEFTRNPTANAESRVTIMQAEHERWLKKREELTNEQKEIVDKQEHSLDSLEEVRQRQLKIDEAESRARELASQKQAIERDEAAKKAAETLEIREIEFAKRYAPIADNAIITLHRLLREYSEKSVEKVSSDFPNGRLSIHGSNMLKDGKIVEGQQVIRVGSGKDWEFRLRTPGRPYKRDLLAEFGREFVLTITAGATTASIRSLSPLHEPGPAKLRLTLSVEPKSGNKPIEPHKPPHQKDCSITEYQKPMEELFYLLIQNRYNATPLTPKN